MKTYCLFLSLVIFACNTAKKEESKSDEFPPELTNFEAYSGNPLFEGAGDSLKWDEKIRERGFILKEDSTWYMWYTGYTRKTGDEIKYLGLATSPDGLKWTRYTGNPIYTKLWVEDVFVMKSDSLYYMFAESKNDLAHLLTSADKINWTDQGELDIRLKNGQPIEKGPRGTPSVWKEGDTWYLFYERNDAAVWLATSKDLKTWTNYQDEPVLECGPGEYDRYAVAMNQIVKHNGRYYAYYHASAFKDWHEWSTNIAVSEDLIHWKKYDKNPILRDDTSSGLVVNDGKQYRLYTMHPAVKVYFPKGN
ncbi:hypothetical protein DYBT9275_00669 [Dyadobacter sp. CECT 9275]|uniref:Glycosylase n=1 Tax=Dyadobacter helix TaxID=2822344 RepID=A0A916J9V0_9BACT|nr:glycosylase [Dyadobacter sp. CECT 9275]CAG4991065.1 hypothetical protein DYBT9275_00669 [Dyadobacter sp. CECT 9275]